MSSQRRTGRITAEGFPYYYLGDALEMAIDDVDLTRSSDAATVGEVHRISSDRRISFTDVPSWTRVDLTVSVSIPERVFAGTLPQSERGEYAPDDVPAEDPPVRLILAIRSRDTILRLGRVSHAGTVNVATAGEYKLSFDLEQDHLRGDVELVPYLVRATSQSDEEAYATRLGDRLASCEEWILEIDDPEDEGGFLYPIIESFDAYDSFPGDDHLHYLNFETPSKPKLYLNADHGDLVSILNGTGPVGRGPRFRDLLYDYIEQSVWQELLYRTASDADPETGELSHPWEEEVVELFVGQLFDEDDEYEDVVRKLGEYANSGEDLDVLSREIDLAIQARVDHPEKAKELLHLIEVDV